MPKPNLRSFQRVLQASLDFSDHEWSYTVSDLPSPAVLKQYSLIKAISIVSNGTTQQILLKLQDNTLSRALTAEPNDTLDSFLLVSFADFRLRVEVPPAGDGDNSQRTRPTTARETSDYILRLLESGIELNSVRYNFYGHSNSQLKSRTCFLIAATKCDIAQRIEKLGDFSKLKTVGKKAKRIGLLFSFAHVAMRLDPRHYEDIGDVEVKDYIFTDGCGLISSHFAKQIVRKRLIAFRNMRYTPSVFQIRYRGYKGVLMVDLTMKDDVWVKFRKSMKKFTGGDDLSFSVVDYSKPYVFGHLNDEVVLLLHSLGIEENVFLRKQEEHLQILATASRDPLTGFRFLTYMNEPEIAEKLLIESIDSVRSSIVRLVNSEYARMLNKRDEQKCRILISKSRLIYGICDPWGVLKEGECAVKITMDGDGQPRALKGMDILITRNPCLHPGDLQKFTAVERDELSHLVDCVIFPTRGRRPSADLMSGGDLDGDKFFVCWDSDLVPNKLSEPAEYPGGKESISFKPITDDDRLHYFAKYNNSSLGRVKNLYLDWARLLGPMSSQCQELNRLFSTCVDGNAIRIPEKLQDPPKCPSDKGMFILDKVQITAKQAISATQAQIGSTLDGYDFDAIELLSGRDNIAMSEFEFLKLVHRWCQKKSVPISDLFYLFDFNLLSTEEKFWALSHLPEIEEKAGMILNALCTSSLIEEVELRQFKLHYPGLRWKRIFDSSKDRLATFTDTLARVLEIFHRKLIVIRVNERLTLAIYVPTKVERNRECQVDDQIRLFAFPHSQDSGYSHRRAVATKQNYRLFCDGNVFQLYNTQRKDTWVFLAKGGSDDSKYRNEPSIAKKRQARQTTVDSGLNYDCRVSIALNKFSDGLQKHVGRVNRNGLLAAEIYVISNRDTKSMQNLDLWLSYVDTNEVIPLFERNAKEYTVTRLVDVDWSLEQEHIISIAQGEDFTAYKNLESGEKYTQTFDWLLRREARGLLLQSFSYLVREIQADKNDSPEWNPLLALQAMLHFLIKAPFLSSAFASFTSWTALPILEYELLKASGHLILQAYILCANEVDGFMIAPFKAVLSQIDGMSLATFGSLIEMISLTVRSTELSLDLFLEGFEPERVRLFNANPKQTQHFSRNMMGIALDHIEEASQAYKSRDDLLELKWQSEDPNGYQIYKSELRIDAPSGGLATMDHVRLIVASSPQNSLAATLYLVDALVASYQQGSATFCCLHPLPPYAEDCSWKLLNCGSFVTTKTMFDAMLTLHTLPEECCYIMNDIIGTQIVLPRASFPDAELYTKESLNPSQNMAVRSSLSRPFTCLWGPPGTGKTHTIVEIINQLLSSAGRGRMLVTAPTHNAVDNVMRKYMAQSPDVGSPSVALRVSTDIQKVAQDLRKYTCDAMMGKEIYTNRSSFNKARDQIKKCCLIFTTCIGAGLGLLRSEKFDTVIIDEASQQTEPASLVPIVKGCKKVVMVGDHLQLGPPVGQLAVLQQYDVSLFERLYRQRDIVPSPPGAQDKRPSAYLPISKVMLDTQYRMHESISSFSSVEFYDGKLRTCVAPETRQLPVSKFPWPQSSKQETSRMIFLECAARENMGTKSKSNEGQTVLCAKICTLLNSKPVRTASVQDLPQEVPSIAVLAPYSRQVEVLKGRLSQFSNVEVSSIDGFQGREADIVIFVTVRCNVHNDTGFLKDLRRLNVVLTRARSGLIVIGHRATLTGGPADMTSVEVWRRLFTKLVETKLGD